MLKGIVVQIILLHLWCKPKDYITSMRNACAFQIIFLIKKIQIDTKLNLYYFEKLHLQAYV